MKTWTDEQLINAVKSSTTYIEVAIKLGLTNLGSNYKTIKKYIAKLDINTSHFLTRKEILKEARNHISKLSHNDLFSINEIDRKYIKNIIIKNNLIDYKCKICNITNWLNQTISLHLDHINGINNDNRLENLRFLCPNCHSQTETYCAKNKKNNILTKQTNHCKICAKEIMINSIRCKQCNGTLKEKIIWPNDNDLLEQVKNNNYSIIAKQLGVSPNAIKKRLHSKGLLIK